MKSAERYLGLILERSNVTVVELTHSSRGYALTAAGSLVSSLNFDDQELFMQPGAIQRERTFAQELSVFLRRITAGSKILSFGLNSRMVMMQTFPLDLELSPNEVEQHAQWELRQCFPNADPESYFITTQVLNSSEDSRIANAVIVAVRKPFVNFLSNVCTYLHVMLHIVDVDHFGAENALLLSNPELNEKKVVFVGVDEDSFDASILVNGTPYDIRTMERLSDTDIDALADFIRETAPDAVFFHGRMVNETIVSTVEQRSGIPVEIVDPFKRVLLPQSIKNFEEISNNKQRYAAAIGLALRTE
ncbi:MAG: pilus assembly protein PilM [Bacteroidota bacterium]|nr:pilus assembly protein PilM [Bacteroidota bacterium]